MPRFTREQASTPDEVERLRRTCRRQAHIIDALNDAVATLRTGAAALKADNADLRQRLREHGPPGAEAAATEFRFTLDERAPGAARAAVTTTLRGRVPAATLERARLVVSELTSNSFGSSRPPGGREILVRVQHAGRRARVEVHDPGSDARAPALDGDPGSGLHLVHAIADRWGVERAAGETTVWAQVADGPDPS